METPRQRRVRKRQRQILDAAVQAFAEKGFYNTKVSEIAAKAGVADGTIYLYFRSKDDILISVFEVRMEEMLRELNRMLEPFTEPRERLTKFISLYVGLVERDASLAEVITVELRQSEKFIREYKNPGFKQLLSMLALIVEDGQTRGDFRDDVDPQVASRAIFGALDELTLWGVLKGLRARPFDADRSAESVARLFLGGLEVPRSNPD